MRKHVDFFFKNNVEPFRQSVKNKDSFRILKFGRKHEY